MGQTVLLMEGSPRGSDVLVISPILCASVSLSGCLNSHEDLEYWVTSPYLHSLDKSELITVTFPMRHLHILEFNPRHLCKVLIHVRTFESLGPERGMCLFDVQSLGGTQAHMQSLVRLSLATGGGLLPSNLVQLPVYPHMGVF